MSASPDVVRDVVLAVVLVVAIVVFLLLRVARIRAHRAPEPAPELGTDGLPPQAAVVVHGGKIDDHDARRRQIEVLSGRLGWRTPVWLETTAEDPGRSQTREAIAGGASVVIAFGGDGTARVVAEELARTGVPMGLLPAGTGNLLARNLGIPPNRLESSLHIALTGRDRTIDVGHVDIGATTDAEPHREAFLVMAGLGFDAEVMAGTDPHHRRGDHPARSCHGRALPLPYDRDPRGTATAHPAGRRSGRKGAGAAGRRRPAGAGDPRPRLTLSVPGAWMRSCNSTTDQPIAAW